MEICTAPETAWEADSDPSNGRHHCPIAIPQGTAERKHGTGNKIIVTTVRNMKNFQTA